MKCPVCTKPLVARVSQGLTAYVCQDHGVWQDWPTVHALVRMAQAENDNDSAALFEGFIWGRLV